MLNVNNPEAFTIIFTEYGDIVCSGYVTSADKAEYSDEFMDFLWNHDDEAEIDVSFVTYIAGLDKPGDVDHASSDTVAYLQELVDEDENAEFGEFELTGTGHFWIDNPYYTDEEEEEYEDD